MNLEIDKLIFNKLDTKIEHYLASKPIKVQSFSIETKSSYLKALDNKLEKIDDYRKACFISPLSGLKKLSFDLSDLNCDNLLLNLSSEVLYYIQMSGSTKSFFEKEFKFQHDWIKYKGFVNLSEVLYSGYVAIEYNPTSNECDLYMILKYTKPNKLIYEIIEQILLEVNSMYIDYGDNNYNRYSIKEGDTIKKIKRDVNQFYKFGKSLY